MHLARPDGWTKYVMTTMNKEVEKSGQRETFFTTLHGSYLHLAVPGTLEVAWEVVKNLHAAESENDGTGDEEETILWGNSKTKEILALGIPSTE